MISNDTIEVSVTYGSKITFFLRMISIGEEKLLRQKAFGLKEEEKAEKEYSTNVQILKDLSVKAPAGMFPDAPKAHSDEDNSIYEGDLKFAGDAIDAFFDEKTVMNERVAYYAIRGYFLKLQPDESFI